MTGQPEEDAYPPLPETARPYGLTVRLAGLLTAAALTVCGLALACAAVSAVRAARGGKNP